MSDCVVRTTHGASLRVLLPVAFLSISCTGTIDDGFFGPRAALEQGPTGATADHPSSAGDPNSPDGVGWTTRFPKLSNRQWENSVRTLLSLSAASGLSQSFT